LFFCFVAAGSVTEAQQTEQPLDRRFAGIVQPFLKNYCFSCHGADKQEGKLDLTGNSSPAAVAKNHRVWEHVLDRLEAQEMPPQKAPRQPTARDDGPLCELVLDDAAKQDLETLWQELNFVTLAPIRQYKDFLFFERAEPPRFAGGAEFDFARPEDKDVTSDSKLRRMNEVYLAKARGNDASDQAIEAIATYFASMSADIRWIERSQRDAEPSHLEALANFAERAYRRPLSQAERDELIAFYRRLREKDRLNHEDAIRDSIVSVLMSPHFCYRLTWPIRATTFVR
jgi:cytochrome c553